MPMRNARRLLAIVLIGLAVVGCSRIGLVYDRLDTLLYLRLGGYVDLDKRQQAELRPRFDALWAWHRHSQLPLYAGDLRQLQRQSGAAMTPEQVRVIADRVRNHGRVLAIEFSRMAVPTLASLSDEQVRALLAEIDQRMAKEKRKQAKLSNDEWAEQRADQALDRLEEWAGSVTPAQRTRIEQWSQASVRPPSDPNAKRRAAFAELLQQRAAPDFPQRVERFSLQPLTVEGMKEREPQRLLSHKLLVDLSQLATPAQRAYLQEKLGSMAMEVDGLAKAPPSSSKN